MGRKGPQGSGWGLLWPGRGTRARGNVTQCSVWTKLDGDPLSMAGMR